MPLSHNNLTDNTLQKDTLLQTPPKYGLKQGIFLQLNNNQPITKHHPAPGFRLSPPRMTSSRCRKGNAGSAVKQTTAGNQFPEGGGMRTARTNLATEIITQQLLLLPAYMPPLCEGMCPLEELSRLSLYCLYKHYPNRLVHTTINHLHL